MAVKEAASDVFAILSNEIRRGVLIHLKKNDAATFSELMKSCNLDITWDCGTLGYHLNLLIGEGIIKKSGKKYELTDFGLSIASLLESIEGMEVKREVIQRTVMTFGKGSYLLECAGTLAKHAKRGDKVYTVVEWDIPKGKRRTEMMEAAKRILGVTGVISLADYRVPQVVGENVPFFEHILVPSLITVLQEIRPNIIITCDPGTSVTPSLSEIIGRSVHLAVEHATWPYWRGEKNLKPIEEYPTIYYSTWKGVNYIVDISEALEQKKEYATICLHRFHHPEVKTMEDAKKVAEMLPDWEVFKIGRMAGYPPEKREKYPYLK